MVVVVAYSYIIFLNGIKRTLEAWFIIQLHFTL
jgi:hypothetical protein